MAALTAAISLAPCRRHLSPAVRANLGCLRPLAEKDEHLHAYYQNWINKNDNGCCNNQDCGEVRDENERTMASGIEVRIGGVWCP
jgi:hypothetical protein